MARHVKGSVPRGTNNPNHIRNIVSASGSYGISGRRGKAGAVGSSSFAEGRVRRNRVRNRFIVIGLIILALVIALAAAVFIYFKTVDDNLALSGSNAQEALVEPVEGEPYYVLCVADLADTAVLPRTDENLAVMLARVDAVGKKLSFLGIPASLEIGFPDGENRPLSSLSENRDDASMIKAVSEFADVSVSHFVYTDSKRLSGMLERLGGIQMELTTEIDDPDAGIQVIEAGIKSLSPSEALTVLRATNVGGGFQGCSSNRIAFTEEVLSKALDGSFESLANVVSDASEFISTDWTASSLLSSAEAIEPFEEMAVYSYTVPCSFTSSAEGDASASLSRTEWETVRAAYVDGADADNADDASGSDNLRKSTVEIRNGTTMEGAASDLAEDLKDLGYTIGEVGNTEEGIVYPETLVIYTDDANEGKARKVLSDISQGRLVNGGDFYTTASDVLVIIGSDWN